MNILQAPIYLLFYNRKKLDLLDTWRKTTLLVLEANVEIFWSFEGVS